MATHGPVCRLGLACLLVGASLAEAQTPVAPAAEPPFFTPDQAVESRRRGRAWLLQHQNADGSWTGKVGYRMNSSYMGRDENPHVGFTALAGLALIEPGPPETEAIRRKAVERAAKWLVELGKLNLYGYMTWHGTRMIEHDYATVFLAELQLRRPNAEVDESLAKSAGLIIRSQSDQGGWEYQPFARNADLVCTVPALEALRACVRAGIEVDPAVFDRAMAYVALCGDRDRTVGGFAYEGKGLSPGRFSFPCTAAGVFTLGEAEGSEAGAYRRGLEFLNANRAKMDPEECGYYFGHYHACRAVRRAYPDWWRSYSRQLRAEIVRNQKPDGSWEDDVGIAYATAMACLILEVCAGS